MGIKNRIYGKRDGVAWSQLLNKFDENCKEIHDEMNKNLPKGIIYHYTSFNGLKGIIEKKRLRYTDYRYLNDSTELKFSIEIIKAAVLASDIRQIHYLIWIIFKIFDNLDNYYNVYISSFSEKEKLALWRYYGANGTGFAIGFNQNFQEINSHGEIGKSCISNVIYGDEKSRAEINKYIRQCLDILEEAGNEARGNTEFLGKLAGRFISQLIPLLPVFKHESFEDEEELRLVHSEGWLLLDPDTGKPYFVDDKYREFVPITSNITVPFVNVVQGTKPAILPDEISSSDISEIVIGPACEFAEARATVRKLLSDNNFSVNKIEIKQAKFPYRS